jgi:hypothetical protein
MMNSAGLKAGPRPQLHRLAAQATSQVKRPSGLGARASPVIENRPSRPVCVARRVHPWHGQHALPHIVVRSALVARPMRCKAVANASHYIIIYNASSCNCWE